MTAPTGPETDRRIANLKALGLLPDEPVGLAAETDRSSEVSERSEERSPAPDLLSPSCSLSMATLDPAALHGIAGQVVETLGSHTEADPVALLLTFLAAAGNILGPGPRAIADAAPHPARLNIVLVGQTSRARKGTAWAQIRNLLAQVHPSWTSGCVLPGIASGEALIAEVRDGTSDEDLGVADKRRLVLEPEFARLLAVAAREGAILSAVLREAWDGNVLKNRTKAFPQVATGAHISVVGHITREELLRRLTDTEAANGYANRHLFALVRRSKRLPEGGQLDPAALDDLAAQVGTAIERGYRVGVLHRDGDARDRGQGAHQDFGDDSDGLAGAITARPEAQTLRSAWPTRCWTVARDYHRAHPGRAGGVGLLRGQRPDDLRRCPWRPDRRPPAGRAPRGRRRPGRHRSVRPVRPPCQRRPARPGPRGAGGQGPDRHRARRRPAAGIGSCPGR